MQKVKKISSCLLAGALCFSLAACDDEERGEKFRVYMPDGAPAIALAGLMDGGFEDASFTVVNASTIAAHVSNGDADFAIMPVNGAAALYNAGKDIVMLSLNTHGNLYVVGDGEGITAEGLVGNRLGVIGQGQVPDLTARMLFEQSGIEYVVSTDPEPQKVSGKVTVSYYEAPALMAALGRGAVDYALLGEPAVTTASVNLDKNIVMDVQAQWKAAFGEEYPQACLVAKGALVREDKSLVNNFLSAVAQTDGWAEANPERARAAIADHMEEGVAPSIASLTASTVVRCNVRTVSAPDAKARCEAYFTKLTTLVTELGKPALGKVPDDGFYYNP